VPVGNKQLASWASPATICDIASGHSETLPIYTQSHELPLPGCGEKTTTDEYSESISK